MRIILCAGKGGVGKTSVAAATGLESAERGLKTMVMSLDPAHSLSDVFDLDLSLMDKNKGQPTAVGHNLWIQELDIHQEIGRNWGEVHRYFSILLNTTGIDGILAEELAILPGMEELIALLHINRYARDETYDLIVLDCAPTAESLRFVSLPKTLDWYMTKVFRLERQMAKFIRPVAKKVADVPLPEDDYFASIEQFYDRLRGVDRLLTDPQVTTARLVTQPEKMILRETQRAFMFFSLHELTVDAVIINRVFPAGLEGDYLQGWRRQQEEYLDLARTFFQPVPILEAPFYRTEVLGLDRLKKLGRHLYEKLNPADVFYAARPYQFFRDNGRNSVKLHLPFALKEEVDLTKIGDELIIKIGSFRRNVILPRTFASLEPGRAHLEDGSLIIDFGGADEQSQG
ncbi:MAG: ArsA family ATPase [Deltaproteobacteria bacterium]|nr:ArsA family ATPase [Deltaproteobacteria bacterium]